MLRTLLFSALVASLIASSIAADTCAATITFRKRTDPYSSWTLNSTTFQIYDIVVANVGSCPINQITGLFSAGNGFISESWNYDIATGLYSSFENNLPVGQSFYGAGFVLANSTTGPTLEFTRPQCNSSCNAQTTAAPSTTQAPTQTPTTQTPTTQAPSTTSAPNTCAVTVVVTKDQNSWLDAQGRNTSVYRLAITNAGPCALRQLVLSFAWGQGQLISSWNLDSTAAGYSVSGFGPTIAVGRVFSDAGFILAGGPQSFAATQDSSVCAC